MKYFFSQNVPLKSDLITQYNISFYFFSEEIYSSGLPLLIQKSIENSTRASLLVSLLIVQLKIELTILPFSVKT